MSEKNEGFNYTYSAKQYETIKRIREKYESPKEDKMERIINLDKKATSKARAIAITMGIIGALVLGFGMSLIMSELSSSIGMDPFSAFVFGIISGLIGAALVVFSYPAYNVCLGIQRKKIAHEIIRLSDELINDK